VLPLTLNMNIAEFSKQLARSAKAVALTFCLPRHFRIWRMLSRLRITMWFISRVMGGEHGGLYFRDDAGNSTVVSPARIAALLKARDDVRCVVLNACFSLRVRMFDQLERPLHNCL
jgi:hypothetical protein